MPSDHCAPPARERLLRNPIALCLLFGLLGTAWLIDPLAASSFDAPQRLAMISAAVAGSLCWLLAPTGPSGRRSGLARLSLSLALLGGLALLVAGLASRDPAAAAESLRSAALMALLLPLGASPALQPRRRLLFYAAGVALGANALISLWQLSGLRLPIDVLIPGGRLGSGALLGNEAYVALGSALLGPAALACALTPQICRRDRISACLLLLLGIVSVVCNRQLTAGVAMLAGCAAVLLSRRLPWRVLLSAMLLATCLAGSQFIPPLRELGRGLLPAVSTQALQRISTDRLGAWAAAEGMWRADPWTGQGPGSFSRYAQEYRLAAEIEQRQRLLPPVTATGFVHAHNEYLQLAAEAGLPALFGTVSALLVLLAGLMRRAAACVEANALLGLLTAATIAALAWFPLQIPFTALLILLALGRSWRLLGAETAA